MLRARARVCVCVCVTCMFSPLEGITVFFVLRCRMADGFCRCRTVDSVNKFRYFHSESSIFRPRHFLPTFASLCLRYSGISLIFVPSGPIMNW